MDKPPTSEYILSKRLEISDRLLAFVSDGNIWPDIVDLLSELEPIDPQFEQIVEKVDLAARMSERINQNPEIDLARDMGILVAGLNTANKVVDAPESGRAFLGGQFVSDNRGIGWIVAKSKERVTKTPAYMISPKAAMYLPIQSEIKEGINNGRLKNLVIIHDFKMFDKARDTIRELYGLTTREIDVCQHILDGKNSAAMAETMNVTRETIKSHLKHIFQKTGLRSQIDLVRTLTQLCSVTAVLNFKSQSSSSPNLHLSQDCISLRSEMCQTRFGTELCYSVCGDPNGRPMVMFHSPIGSRTHWDGMMHGAKKHGVKLYTLDRPRYGNSEPIPNYNAVSIAACIDDLLEANGETEADFAAFGIGGRMALSAYPYIKTPINNIYLYSFSAPHRPNIETPITGKENQSIFQKLNSLLHTNPLAIGAMWKIIGQVKSEAMVAKVLRSAYKDSPVDSKALSSPAFFQFMYGNIYLSVRQGGRSQAYEFQICKSIFEHKFDLFDNVNIIAAYGSEDKNNTHEAAKEFINNFPQSRLISVHGQGQLFILFDFGGFLKIIYGAQSPT